MFTRKMLKEKKCYFTRTLFSSAAWLGFYCISFTIFSTTDRCWVVTFSCSFVNSISTAHTAVTPIAPFTPVTIAYCLKKKSVSNCSRREEKGEKREDGGEEESRKRGTKDEKERKRFLPTIWHSFVLHGAEVILQHWKSYRI